MPQFRAQAPVPQPAPSSQATPKHLRLCAAGGTACTPSAHPSPEHPPRRTRGACTPNQWRTLLPAEGKGAGASARAWPEAAPAPRIGRVRVTWPRARRGPAPPPGRAGGCPALVLSLSQRGGGAAAAWRAAREGSQRALFLQKCSLRCCRRLLPRRPPRGRNDRGEVSVSVARASASLRASAGATRVRALLPALTPLPSRPRRSPGTERGLGRRTAAPAAGATSSRRYPWGAPRFPADLRGMVHKEPPTCC
ncbi:unnamed protein product [Nyctereutes procyonoides]|uniref:(raccoon dog) hypothetical protein n=1 Tax=Nyctereutes procyonoides TaxID=34880 RepID=A0A811Z242_NYCPR|nr:unnamed protein product [Nyctereutes procyonoides]